VASALSLRTSAPSNLITVIGLSLTAVYAALVVFLAGSISYDVWAALVIGPLLIAVTLPILARVAKPEKDPRLFKLLVWALAFKAVGTLFRYYFVYVIYAGRADAAGYHGRGMAVAESLKEGFQSGVFQTGLQSLTDTDFIRLFTGILYTIMPPTNLGAFLIYGWLAFMGLLLLYRAFVIAVPEGRSRSYAKLLFFFPSLVFWPSSIGKEAWMMLTIGIAAYGIARILSGSTWRGLVFACLGLWLGAVVRAHISGMLAIALAGGFLLKRPRESLRQLAPLVKIGSLVAVVVVAMFFLSRTQEFLKLEGNPLSSEGLTEGLESPAKAAQGGSETDPIIVKSPVQLPAAVATSLFRPFVFEAHNPQALGTALEGTFLMILTLVRLPWLLQAVKSVRRQPYVAFALLYTAMFVVAFASFPNLGLLARERVQVLPFFFLLLCIPTKEKRDEVEQAAT